ncbi:MAG: nitric-oxide reductase large subunit [Elusimicrobia bacterium]|nr:nitric-oxide reductase large subunit [Elusimicrobiota bacterium]
MTNDRKPLGISPWWRHGAVLTIIVGITGLLFMGRNTYKGAPPYFNAVTTDGRMLFTSDDIVAGQSVFQKFGLMDYGTLFGHGGYRGPDFTADTLHQLAVGLKEIYAVERGGAFASLSESDRAIVSDRVITELKTNRYDETTGAVSVSPAYAHVFEGLVARTTALFKDGSQKLPLPANYISDPNDLRTLSAFFSWSAWAAVTPRPGKNHSYTNNWPPDEEAGNRPSLEIILWSALSIISLLGALGLVLMFFGRFDFLGWGGDKIPLEKIPSIESTPITRSQKATYNYFLVVSLLFLFQTVMGVLTAHYFVESAGLYGFDIRNFLPITITRSWHLQLSIFWIATAWLAAGIFVGPMVSKTEPKGQAALVHILFGAVVLVAVGSIVGEWLGIKGLLGKAWFWLGHQGWEYLELGRLWQILLTVGMALWAVIVFRSIQPTLKGEDRGGMPYLLLYSIVAIPVMYSFGMLYKPGTNFAVADFWRWWIVHLWVEGFFELFTTIVVAHIFVILGLAPKEAALRVVYLDIILYLGSGMIGTAHHYYWTAQPAINLALGAFFSAMEVVPLCLLTLEAWNFIKLRQNKSIFAVTPIEFPHKWTVMFLMAVGFWNFLGAGIFGFLINLPIVSYYEHATYLTSNHGHAALMGVYGNLAIAALAFCARLTVEPHRWNDKLWGISFWSLNIGLLLMLALNIFPAGIYQLVQSIQHGFWYARSEAVIQSTFFQVTTWSRVVGDMVFVLGGVVPIAYFMVTRLFSLRQAK